MNHGEGDGVEANVARSRAPRKECTSSKLRVLQKLS